MIFVDAGAFIARYRVSDQWHGQALGAWRELARQCTRCFTGPLVIAEAARILQFQVSSGQIARMARSWCDTTFLDLVRSDTIQELRALDLMHKYADQTIGFVDCVSFVLMRKHRLTGVFGFERHFHMAGFELWPGHGRK
jgi:predicted nucleic acid-binding protein